MSVSRGDGTNVAAPDLVVPAYNFERVYLRIECTVRLVLFAEEGCGRASGPNLLWAALRWSGSASCQG
ncbi:hypothetical protein ACKKBG_A24675 [Auxenochlorella protothecoides x Auxenochlorella symbiontica]